MFNFVEILKSQVYNPKIQSPLRYPGGKACLTSFIEKLASLNGLIGGTYIELYAGGAGAALNLLYNGVFSRIHINDYDYSIYAMWYSILNHTKDFIKLIEETEICIDSWHKQKEIYALGNNNTIQALGFATFFLNRTNRSGIIYKAGPIGGLEQTGNYLIDVRFNKPQLIERVKKIASHRDQITLSNLDGLGILKSLKSIYPDYQDIFLYLDPPYYVKGSQLYLNNYAHDDHKALAKVISNIDPEIKWLISYDNVDPIRKMYQSYRMSSFNLNYTLQSKKFGSELLIFSQNLAIGSKVTVNSRSFDLVLLNR